MKILRLILAVLLLTLAGCATKAGRNPNIDWSSRIGSYTYEQALAELGRPQVLGESGEGRTAEWVTRRSPGLSFGIGLGHGIYTSRTGVGLGVGTSISPPPKGECLRLRFDREGRLAAWERVRY